MADSQCVACGKDSPSRVGIGGVLFCRLCAEAYNEWSAAERQAGLPTSAAKWAVAQQRERAQATTIRLSPQAIEAADRLAERRGISRSVLIEVLIMSEAERTG